MSILPPLKYGLKIASKLQIKPGQLVYCREKTSITACFYEFLRSRGIELSHEESDYLPLLRSELHIPGRPCIVLDRHPNLHFSVCFISQIKGREFSPIGRFFGVPIDNTKALPDASHSHVESDHTPLRLTDPTGDDTRAGRFYLFAIPVVRRAIYVPPRGPRYLVDRDLERTVELVRQRVAACDNIHPALRREQLDWVQANPNWRWRNPQEEGVDMGTYLRL